MQRHIGRNPRESKGPTRHARVLSGNRLAHAVAPGHSPSMEFRIDDGITLRLLEAEDAEALFRVVDANRAHLRRWLPWLDGTTKPQHSRAFIESIHRQNDAGAGFACGVFVGGELAGMCGFHKIDDANRSVTIGYWLAEAHQGEGVITRCTRFFIDYAFREFALAKVLIPVAEGNARSRAICERLDFVSEGTLEKAENLYGTWVDHVRYAMTSDRWAGLHKTDGHGGS